MELRTSKRWRLFKDYMSITIGLTVYVFGWSVFLLPNNLVGGGVSGMSAIIQYATHIPMGYSYLFLNLCLLLIGFIANGKGFGFKTIYAIILTSILLRVIPPVIPPEFIETFSIPIGKMLCTIIGGILSGVGIGMAITVGGSTGGTDIIALIICKHKPISPGKLILLIDVVIVSSSLILPSYDIQGNLLPFVDKAATCIYGLILITVSGYSVDLFLAGTQQSVQAFIFSKKHEELADAITFDLKRGVTVIPAKGWYTKSETDIVMVVLRKTDLNVLLRCVKSIDPDAFVSINNASGVYGQGFDTIKVNSHQERKKKIAK